MKPEERAARRRGVICIVTSAFGFAVMAMFVRLTDTFGEELPAIQKSFFRNLVAAFAAGAAFWRAGGAARLPRGKALGVLTLRSAFGTAGIFANFYAIGKLPLGDAMMLNKLSPFFTMVCSWLALGERMGARQAWCVALALGGAACVAKPGFAGADLFAAGLGVFGGLAAGMAYTCVRALGRMKVEGSVIVLFFSVFSCVASAPVMAWGWKGMTMGQAGCLLGAGLGAAVGQFGVTAAYRHAPPRSIGVWDYSNIVFSALLGFAVFGQVPDAFSWAGFALIFLAGVLQICKN